MVDALGALSDAIGWIYTLAWSASFWPQIYLNHTRKSVTGLSFEYQAYNITGFLFYTVYLYSNYVTQHDKSLGLTQSVEVNDLVFVTHAIFMTAVTIYQCVRYKLTSHTLNKWHLNLVCVFWILAAYNLALVAGGILPFVNRHTHYQYSMCEFLGYVKVAISFVKYCPQAWMNFSRKSTVGFAIGGIVLDLTGGLTSLAQQSLNAYREGNTDQFTSNAAKLLLSVESIAFDLLFLLQHFVLYRSNNREQLALLASQGGQLTREEMEALEAETQAKAAAAAAALIGAVKRVADGAGAGGDHEAVNTSLLPHSGSYHVRDSSSPAAATGHAHGIDLRPVVGERRGSESHKSHLLLPSQRDASSDSVF